MRAPRLALAPRGRRAAVAVAVIALLTSACASDPAAEVAEVASDATPPSVLDLVPTDVPTLAPAPTGAPTVDATAPAPAGEPVDFVFAEGDTLGVVGVAADDVLNVREGPGADRRVVARRAPLADDVTATGRARSVDRSIWVEVEAGDTTGWANSRFLAYLGATVDTTAEIVEQLGERPTAETLVDLGDAVALSQAATDPPSRIALVQRPGAGDVRDVVFDVIGVGDDAVLGVRLRVFGAPVQDGEGVELRSVERTLLCDRGVTDDGRCV